MSCVHKNGHRCMSQFRGSHPDASLPEVCLNCDALTSEELEALVDPDIIGCHCGNCAIGCWFDEDPICEAATCYHKWEPKTASEIL